MLFCFGTVVDFFFLFLFLQRLSPRSLPQIYKFGQKFGAPPPKKIGGPKASQFGPNFGQLSNLIANVSGTK